MPDRDGLWLIRQLSLRAQERGNSLWAIALTGNALPHIRDAAAQAGFHVFLAKPFGFEELVEAVSRRRMARD